MQILVKLSNGKLAFIRPTAERLKEESNDEYLSRVASITIEKCARAGHAGWDGASIAAFVPDDVINAADWAFRDGWDWNTEAMSMDYDMAKCRDIYKAQLRRLRAPKLQALDAEYMKADEVGDTASKERISTLKQTLRDLTNDPSIEKASSPSELRIPDILK